MFKIFNSFSSGSLMYPSLLAVLFTLIFSSLCSASHHLTVHPNITKLNIGPYFEILEDPSGEMDIKDVSSPAISKKFMPNTTSSINIGSTQSAYWFRCSFKPFERKSVQNQVGINLNSNDWLLFLGKHLDFYDEIAFFWKETLPGAEQTSAEWHTQHHGMNHAIQTGKRDPLGIRLTIPPGGSQAFTVYLRVKTSFGLFIDPVIYSPIAFYKFSKKLSVFYGVYYGIVIAMLIYNLFHYYFLREKVRLIFILYASTLCIYFLVSNELSFSIFPTSFLAATLKGAQLLALISFIQMLWFSMAFLNASQTIPRTNRLLQAIMLIPSGLILALPFFSYASIGSVISDVGMIVLAAVIVAGIAALKKGYRPARFFLFAWGFFLTGGLIYALNFKGLFPYPFIGNNAAQAGSAIEMLLLSIAIADRVKFLFDKMNAEQLERQKQLNRMSQQLVNAEERERKRIAGILHDSIGQTMAATKWEIEGLVAAGKIQKHNVSKLLTFLNEGIRETRTLTADLYPKALHEFGLKMALESLAEMYSDRYGLAVSVKTDTIPDHIDEQLSIILYRAVSELLLNIVKHAHARHAEIFLTVDSQSAALTVLDDGVGFNQKNTSDTGIEGFGLFSIQEKLNRIDGSLNIDTGPVGGTQVTLKVPTI